MERDTEQADPQQAFYDHVIAKYADDDAREMAKEDGVAVPAAKADRVAPQATDDADEDTAAHPDAGTSSDDPDEDTDESAADADADDDEGHPDDEEDVDEPDNDDESEDDTEPVEEDEEVTDETRAALTSKGADLSLEDIPKEYQGPVKAKLRNIDAAFSRQSAENTAFRAERTRFQAEEQFRAENPELFIVELLQQGGEELYRKVDERLQELDSPKVVELFEAFVRDKRRTVATQIEEAQAAHEHLYTRANHVYDTAVKFGRKAGLTPELADRAVERVLLQKPEGQRDVSDAEIAAAIREAAQLQAQVNRGTRRQMSKELIQNRTATRKAVSGPGKRPTQAASPRPAGERPHKVDYNNEASRHAAMMKTARRLIPGAR